MNYTSLYRKFRPLNFDEMVGQDHITTTLKNQIISNRVGHAYLFNGGRGTGKTSAAKILARAVNCLNLKDGNPCNECEICKAILEGSLTDVVEMDAASNNSVEDIRSIREEVNFLPTIAKYRVYIIDEVHMLSTGAFNALLKTLEEPPAHVKFILATTEPQKLPATILSRCQRFDFKKISVENISKRLKLICDEINLKITDDALNLIGVISEGAMRDSLSILERCIQDGEDNISEDKIRDIIGIPKVEYISKIVESVINFDVDSAILITDKVLNDGKDINYLLWETIKYLNNMLIFKSCGKINIYNKNDIEIMKDISNKATKQRILNLIYEFSNLENDIKWSSQKNIMFQSRIIKMCIKIDDNDLETRIKNLEDKLEDSEKYVIKKIDRNTDNQKEEKKINKITMQKNEQRVNKKSSKYWQDVIKKLKDNGKIMIYTNLLNTTAVEVSNDILEIEFTNGITNFGKTILNNKQNVEEISNIVEEISGKRMKIKYRDEKNNNNKEDINGLNSLGIPINIID